VFTSPAAVKPLLHVGLKPSDIAGVARAIPAMRVETQRGTTFDLSYGGTGSLADSPVGLDRSVLDPMFLAMASAAGADVRTGVTVETMSLAEPGVAHLTMSGGRRLDARVVVGADGLRSIVAAAAGVARPPALGRRTGLTFHVTDGSSRTDGQATDLPMDARMVVIDHGYVGLAPVPGNRLNVGIVLGASWLPKLRKEGAARVARSILERVHPRGSVDATPVLDHVAGASPLGSGARRRAGPGWLLVGDAAGFLDPFTGEGLHRAIVSAEMAVEAIVASRAAGASPDLRGYDKAMGSRFAMKDLVSRIAQAFLGQPVLFEYAARRLAARSELRETMGLVIGDLVPASKALDPRFLARLLAP
jgi:menaquinone-9 beta-reductase